MKTYDRLSPLSHILLVILLALIAYSNTYNSSFHFDDGVVIINNPIIKDLSNFTSPSEARDYKGHFEYHTFKRRYIGYLTFALNYRLHGLDVYGYHVVNLLIHIITSCLLYFLVLFSFRTPLLSVSSLQRYAGSIALFTALIFSVHPVQTQAVTYIWQRITSLSALFYLLSLVLYIRARLSPGFYAHPLVYILSIISAVLAMKSKEIAFMLPLSILLYEFMFFKDEKDIKKRVMYLIPPLLTMLIIPITLVGTDRPLGELIGDVSAVTQAHTELSRGEYLLTEFRVIITYIRLMFLPVGQNLDYDYPVYRTLWNPGVALSAVFLAAMIGAGLFVLKRYKDREPGVRLIAFGILWFFLNLVLESSVIPLSNVIYEHRLYLPSAGLILLVVTAFYIGTDRLKCNARAMAAVLSAVVVILGSAAYARNRVWMDEISLWQDVVNKSPYKVNGHINLGNAYLANDDNDRAMAHYQTALKLDKDAPDAHYNLGLAYQSQGLIDRAITHYRITLRHVPAYSEAHNNLANAYRIKGLIDNAITHYRLALKFNPGIVEAHNNLGNVYVSQGLIDRAIGHYLAALKLDPYRPAVFLNLGNAYSIKGLTAKAIENFSQLKKLKPEWVLPYNKLGRIYLQKGDLEQARRELQRALQIDPDNQETEKLLKRTMRN
jgi:tetratricopeptide (TPR) repeat protein